MTVDVDVVVVGAGPTGLMLAGELRLAGVDAVVLERRPAPTGLSKALGLYGRAVQALDYRGLLDRGFRGRATAREHWHAPVGDRRTRDQRTKDRLPEGQRAFNRLHAGLRALVEQAIAHLANAWPLRRWRGLLYRVRDVFRATGALICLGRWLHRIPT